MKRLACVPNLVIATLWADLLVQAGFGATVQRAYGSAIAGEIPPDQAGPEVWIDDAGQFDAARLMLAALTDPPSQTWCCRACGERIEGPFLQCWACGAMAPT